MKPLLSHFTGSQLQDAAFDPLWEIAFAAQSLPEAFREAELNREALEEDVKHPVLLANSD